VQVNAVFDPVPSLTSCGQAVSARSYSSSPVLGVSKPSHGQAQQPQADCSAMLILELRKSVFNVLRVSTHP
jgi:hypothetical protein